VVSTGLRFLVFFEATLSLSVLLGSYRSVLHLILSSCALWKMIRNSSENHFSSSIFVNRDSVVHLY